jgi:hypothetical protein
MRFPMMTGYLTGGGLWGFLIALGSPGLRAGSRGAGNAPGPVFAGCTGLTSVGVGMRLVAGGVLAAGGIAEMGGAVGVCATGSFVNAGRRPVIGPGAGLLGPGVAVGAGGVVAAGSEGVRAGGGATATGTYTVLAGAGAYTCPAGDVGPE